MPRACAPSSRASLGHLVVRPRDRARESARPALGEASGRDLVNPPPDTAQGRSSTTGHARPVKRPVQVGPRPRLEPADRPVVEPRSQLPVPVAQPLMQDHRDASQNQTSLSATRTGRFQRLGLLYGSTNHCIAERLRPSRADEATQDLTPRDSIRARQSRRAIESDRAAIEAHQIPLGSHVLQSTLERTIWPIEIDRESQES